MMSMQELVKELEKLSMEFHDRGSTAGDDWAQDAYYYCSEKIDNFVKLIEAT